MLNRILDSVVYLISLTKYQGNCISEKSYFVLKKVEARAFLRVSNRFIPGKKLTVIIVKFLECKYTY